MANILVRGLDDRAAANLREKAKRAGRSLNDIAKEALARHAEDDVSERNSFWDRVAERRRRLGPMESSLDTIRDLRERAW